ncbi:MAG: hypothetical protein HW405_922, partial [Candidatus Berkelbacteria bacterium]|nr:hypothetical protein [Candidatus Berkelbacteria bacterium]
VIRGQEKLGIINEVKKQMGLDTSESGYGYDKIDMGI